MIGGNYESRCMGRKILPIKLSSRFRQGLCHVVWTDENAQNLKNFNVVTPDVSGTINKADPCKGTMCEKNIIVAV